MVLYSHATKTHFQKKGFAFYSLCFERESFWNSELVHSMTCNHSLRRKHHCPVLKKGWENGERTGSDSVVIYVVISCESDSSFFFLIFSFLDSSRSAEGDQ